MQRVTKQRTAILKSLSSEMRPLTIEEILELALSDAPTINLSTVYRNLKALLAEKKIAQVELPGEKTCYELVKLGHHHHFLCDACGKVFNLDGCPKGLLDLVPNGFKLLGHQISLNGFCSSCVPRSSFALRP